MCILYKMEKRRDTSYGGMRGNVCFVRDDLKKNVKKIDDAAEN